MEVRNKGNACMGEGEGKENGTERQEAEGMGPYASSTGNA